MEINKKEKKRENKRRQNKQELKDSNSKNVFCRLIKMFLA